MDNKKKYIVAIGLSKEHYVVHMTDQRPIIREQLFSEEEFIRYCNDSNDNRVGYYGKLRVRVGSAFLRAAEKDGFLSPLLMIEEPRLQEDGTTKVELARYYSPFQIYVIAQLSNNKIEDGQLQSPDTDKEWQKQQKCRFVSWGYGGGMSSNIEHPDFRKGVDANGRVNQYGVCEYLHNFLRLLHSLELPLRYSEIIKQERIRYYTSAPKLQYDLAPLAVAGGGLLVAYGLDEKKLEVLRVNIGHTAFALDPLEKWYPFVQRLPQWRRDELKGEAVLAQDLYGFCELVADVSETITGQRPESLPIALRSDFLSPIDKRNEYASGTDVEAIKLAISQMREWMSKEENVTLVRQAVGQDAPEKCIERLKTLDEEIKGYNKHYEKYGVGRSVSNWGFMHFGSRDSKSILLKDLDPKAQKIATQMFEQMKAQGALGDEEQEMQSQIRHAIRWRLDDINRDFVDLVYQSIQHIDNKRWQLESKMDSHQYTAKWQAEYETTHPFEDKMQRHADFWRKFVPVKRAELDKEIEPLKEASRKLGSFANLAHLVLCANCRKNTVLLHQTHNDKRVSPEAICDECMGKGEFQKIKGAEWCCEQCGRKIYTFAHGNVLSDVLFNNSNATIRLEYGQISIRARCTNKDCKRWNEERIDWGWLP